MEQVRYWKENNNGQHWKQTRGIQHARKRNIILENTPKTKQTAKKY